MLILSSTLISLALVFYSIGIWAERLAHYLKPWHVISFWLGLFFDVSGTMAMSHISKREFNFFDLHTLTGQLALWLMLSHAVWATWVIHKGSESLHKKFHRYSIVVWCFWLIPYFGGMFLGMKH
ncbi:MAG: HsmA family protein [Candidatus Kapabacteria bacterium]|nr:HsmA family protein [Candidatus Kapabacteria bacterium]